MKLWPKPNVRPTRFYDLRHSTATLLLREGVPLAVVQRVLRHEDPKLTAATYGHLERDFLLASVDRLRFEGMPEPEPVRARAAAGARGTLMGPTQLETPKGPKSRRGNPSNLDPFGLRAMRESNPRPLAPEKASLHFRWNRTHAEKCRIHPNPARLRRAGRGVASVPYRLQRGGVPRRW